MLKASFDICKLPVQLPAVLLYVRVVLSKGSSEVIEKLVFVATLVAEFAGVKVMFGAVLSLKAKLIVATVDKLSPSLNCKVKLSPSRAPTSVGW